MSTDETAIAEFQSLARSAFSSESVFRRPLRAALHRNRPACIETPLRTLSRSQSGLAPYFEGLSPKDSTFQGRVLKDWVSFFATANTLAASHRASL